jgi:hypothetical protein
VGNKLKYQYFVYDTNENEPEYKTCAADEIIKKVSYDCDYYGYPWKTMAKSGEFNEKEQEQNLEKTYETLKSFKFDYEEFLEKNMYVVDLI